MSRQYDQYLVNHKSNVTKGYIWMEENLPEILSGFGLELNRQICTHHDESKTESDEYFAYDAYFYGNNRSYKVVADFNKAWLVHIHRNPHHWQHWVLINDDPKEGTVCIEMPTNYVIEMICDWWAFSWEKGNLFEIFQWYREHTSYIKLHHNTQTKVEQILSSMYRKLRELGYEDKEG